MAWRSKGERWAALDCAFAAERGEPLVGFSTHILQDAKTRTHNPEATARIDARLAEIQGNR